MRAKYPTYRRKGRPTLEERIKTRARILWGLTQISHGWATSADISEVIQIDPRVIGVTLKNLLSDSLVRSEWTTTPRNGRRRLWKITNKGRQWLKANLKANGAGQ